MLEIPEDPDPDASNNLNALAWSLDGTQIAVGARRLWLWDTASGQATMLNIYGGNDIAWTRDGRLALALTDIRVVDTRTFEVLQTYPTDPNRSVMAAAWSPDGTRLAYGRTELIIVTPPIPRTGTGLRGEYFDNADLTGRKFFRLNPTINFAWGTGSPDPAIAADTFSVRWTGQVEPLYSETYTFITTHDDGARLWVNGQPLISDWANHAAPVERSGAIPLTAGVKYDLVLEYYEHTGSASARLEWSSPRQPRQVIPAAQLYPPRGQLAFTGRVRGGSCGSQDVINK